jgi:integrase
VGHNSTLDTPKSGHGRTVDISRTLADTLASLELAREQETLKYGWRDLPPWLFVTKTGTPVDQAYVRRAMLRVLKAAKLPPILHPARSAPTYASILLAEGVSSVYVQEQLGHATIELTVSTYGRWLKKKAPGALDRLDSMAVPQSGSRGCFCGGSGGDPLSRSPLHSST